MHRIRKTFGTNCHSIKPRKIIRGFHLLELLITVAIIAILAAISVPTYSHYVVMERRIEAAAMLSKLALALEQYHLEHNTYDGATLGALHFSEVVVKGYYQLRIQLSENEQYSLTAVPLGKQATKDETCAALTLQSTGEKSITGTGKIEECW